MEFYPIAVHEIEAGCPLAIRKYKVLATVSSPVIGIVVGTFQAMRDQRSIYVFKCV
jgi:hypothetical protein